MKKWRRDKQREQEMQRAAAAQAANQGGISPRSELDEESYDSGVDHHELKKMLDADEHLQQQIDGALFSSDGPGKKYTDRN